MDWKEHLSREIVRLDMIVSVATEMVLIARPFGKDKEELQSTKEIGK